MEDFAAKKLASLIKANKSTKFIAAEMQRMFGKQYTSKICAEMARQLGLKMVTYEANDTFGKATQEMIRASVFHLIDLKRAGHSPTRTELSIASGDRVRHFSRAAERASYVGSAAAMCAESNL